MGGAGEAISSRPLRESDCPCDYCICGSRRLDFPTSFHRLENGESRGPASSHLMEESCGNTGRCSGRASEYSCETGHASDAECGDTREDVLRRGHAESALRNGSATAPILRPKRHP